MQIIIDLNGLGGAFVISCSLLVVNVLAALFLERHV
jgi:hypothetical protein